jgi:hypothetical protein
LKFLFTAGIFHAVSLGLHKDAVAARNLPSHSGVAFRDRDTKARSRFRKTRFGGPVTDPGTHALIDSKREARK